MCENGNGEANGNGINGNGSLLLSELNPQHRAFVLAYCFGETRGHQGNSARAAGYGGEKPKPDTLYVQGCRLLRNVKIKETIKELLATEALSEEQIRGGWGEIANQPGPAAVLGPGGVISESKMKEYSHLIQEFSYTKGRGFKVKFYSRLDALNAAARAQGMFRDVIEHEGRVEIVVDV